MASIVVVKDAEGQVVSITETTNSGVVTTTITYEEE